MTGPLLTTMVSEDARYALAKKRWVDPFDYQERQGGKKIRTELTHAMASLFGIGERQANLLCEVVEKFNAASLIHDDIVDQSEVRRGAPSVWMAFGVGAALNCGMHGYVHGLQLLAKLERVDLLEVGLKSLEALHMGQYLDTQVSEGSALPTMEEYRFIAETNTGCFFVLILDFCQLLKPLSERLYVELKALMLELAVYYRYVNDYCDINHIPHFEKKGFAPDLDEGPKSFLMILADCPLIKKKRSDEQKQKIIVDFGRAGIFSQAKKVMDASYEKILQHLNLARDLSTDRNITPLSAFLCNIRFEQQIKDNYYEGLV
ncbi:polyprenyl synthetase family protein [Dyella humi]